MPYYAEVLLHTPPNAMVNKEFRNKYRNGAAKERRIMNKFRDKGYISFRSAGSHSPIDVFAIDPQGKKIWLIQSKLKMTPELKAKLEEENKNLNGLFTVEFKAI